MSAKRKQSAVLRLLRGEDLELLSRELSVPAAELSAWRDAFLQAPYLRDTLVAAGILAETFETAITWDRFAELVDGVRERVREALGAEGALTCRLTHVYPDGAAPYFTVLAPARRGEELRQWEELKVAASEAIASAGGTITHHHAVGTDHAPWLRGEIGELGVALLRAAKATLDPSGVMNPGKLMAADLAAAAARSSSGRRSA